MTLDQKISLEWSSNEWSESGDFYMCTKYNWRVLDYPTDCFWADAERYEFSKQIITISYRYYRQWNPP